MVAGSILAGVVVGAAAAYNAYANGVRDPERLFEAFGEGFLIGTVAFDVAVLAYRGIAWAGRALANWARSGAKAAASAEAAAEGSGIAISSQQAGASTKSIFSAPKCGRGPVAKGKIGEAMSVYDRTANGDILLGRQVTFELPSGKRVRVDLIFRDSSGRVYGVDAKFGFWAKLTRNQKSCYPWLQNVIPRGANAEEAGFIVGKPMKNPLEVLIDEWP